MSAARRQRRRRRRRDRLTCRPSRDGKRAVVTSPRLRRSHTQLFGGRAEAAGDGRHKLSTGAAQARLRMGLMSCMDHHTHSGVDETCRGSGWVAGRTRAGW